MPPTDFGFGPDFFVLRMLDVGLPHGVSSGACWQVPPLQTKQSPQSESWQHSWQVPRQHTWGLGQSELAQQPWHVPPQHTPELQAVPSPTLWQVPVLESHAWHSGHVTGVPLQTPFWQVSFVVQGSRSSQGLPVSAVWTQLPVDGSHAAEWHWSDGAQATGLLPVHTPVWQV
jgi:hypothetical protein